MQEQQIVRFRSIKWKFDEIPRRANELAFLLYRLVHAESHQESRDALEEAEILISELMEET